MSWDFSTDPDMRPWLAEDILRRSTPLPGQMQLRGASVHTAG